MLSLCKIIPIIRALAQIIGYLSQFLMAILPSKVGDTSAPVSIPPGDNHPDGAIYGTCSTPANEEKGLPLDQRG